MTTLVGARIATPGDWSDLDLDPRTRHNSVRRAVRRAVAHDPHLEGNAVRLIGILDDILAQAVGSGAFFCSSLVLGSVRDLLVANVLMQITPDAEFGAPVFASPSASATSASASEEICSALAAVVSCDAAWAGADVTVVSLPRVGPVVRCEAVAGGVCVQYLIPVPESSRQVVLTFTSPCPPYVAALVELFDAMAASFALDYADDVGADAAEAPAG